MIRAGPVGGRATGYMVRQKDGSYKITDGDVVWDEKGRTNITHIYIAFDKYIRSIQFGYLENGALVMSSKFGSSEGFNLEVVKLNQDEYVTGFSVTPIGTAGHPIGNLTFHTNRGKYGPFGSLDGAYANCPEIEIDPAISDRREFCGFFGSNSENYLTSIGFYVNHIAEKVLSDNVVDRENI